MPTDSQERVLTVLRQHAVKGVVQGMSIRKLAESLGGKNTRSVQQALQRLEESGRIVVTHSNNGKWCNEYTLVDRE